MQSIIDLYNSGLSSRMVSAQTGVSNTQVNRILKRNGVQKRSAKTPDELEHKIIQRYVSGESSEKIAQDLKINGTTVCRILKRNNIEIRSSEENKRQYKINDTFFDAIDTEAKAYFLGYMYTDGTVNYKNNSATLVLHKKDRHILELFSEIIYGNKDHIQTYDKEDHMYVHFSIYSSKIKQDLIKHGCTPRKTLTLRLPNIEKHLMHHFLRGVLDGDGCCFVGSIYASTLSITGSKLFLSDIKSYLFNELNILGSHSSSKRSEKTFGLYYSKQIYLNKLITYLYKDSTIYLTRKQEKANSILEGIVENQPMHYATNNIIKHNNNRLTKPYLLSLNMHDKKELAKFVFDYFRSYGFPFPKYQDEELKRDFNNISKINADLDSKSLAGNKIIHHFCEHFFKVKSRKQPSLFDAFHDDERLMSTINNRMGISYKETFNITGNMIRQGLRNSHNAFAASFFKPITARLIYEKYAPQNADVLDISAGFGQRMLGACSAKNVKSYTGLDPWVQNFEAISNIKEFLELNNVYLHNIGSEHFCTDRKFDFCFSSPPFFDKEVYSDEDTQAYFNRTFEEFIYEYWLPTVQNVYNYLKPNSLFVLNMDTKMAEVMITCVQDKFKLIERYEIGYDRLHLAKPGVEVFFVLQRVDI